MSIKDYKKGAKRTEDQAIENARKVFWKCRYPFSFKNRGSWHNEPPRRHPGWAAYHANKPDAGSG
jgi:hypothetical protein